MKNTLSKVTDLYRKERVQQVLYSGQRSVRAKAVEHLQRHSGVDVMVEDWDNLFILDACRYDAFKHLHSLPGELQNRKSQSSNSEQFVENNFSGNSYLDTVCVTANPYYGRLSDDFELFKMISVWETADDYGYIDPDLVAERAREAARSHPRKRLIVHFMQPHVPYILNNKDETQSPSEHLNYKQIVEEEIPPEEVRSMYAENLHRVLNTVEDLLDELGGKTVVTADHGELLGERISDFYHHLHPSPPIRQHINGGVHDYGHCKWMDVPELTEVPWLVHTDGDRRTITEGSAQAEEEIDSSNIDEKLRALGYVN